MVVADIIDLLHKYGVSPLFHFVDSNLYFILRGEGSFFKFCTFKLIKITKKNQENQHHLYFFDLIFEEVVI